MGVGDTSLSVDMNILLPCALFSILIVAKVRRKKKLLVKVEEKWYLWLTETISDSAVQNTNSSIWFQSQALFCEVCLHLFFSRVSSWITFNLPCYRGVSEQLQITINTSFQIAHTLQSLHANHRFQRNPEIRSTRGVFVKP